MMLSAYKEEIQSRQTFLGRIQRLNNHFPFMLGTQFLCLATSETSFQIVVDKLVLCQKINFYKGKKVILKYDEDEAFVHFVKACLGRLVKHEDESLDRKMSKSEESRI